MKQQTRYDISGNGYSVGSVMQGFGLHNAGRYYTVRALGKTSGRIYLEEHRTQRHFWTFDRWYRVSQEGAI